MFTRRILTLAASLIGAKAPSTHRDYDGSHDCSPTKAAW